MHTLVAILLFLLLAFGAVDPVGVLVALAPTVNLLAPYIIVVVGAVASWTLHRIATKNHLQALDSHRDVLVGAIENGVAWALKRLPANATVDARTAAALNYVLPKVPDALKALKVTPESLAQVIQAKLPADPPA